MCTCLVVMLSSCEEVTKEEEKKSEMEYKGDEKEWETMGEKRKGETKREKEAEGWKQENRARAKGCEGTREER